MPSTTANDGVSLSLSVIEVVENFGLEEKIVGITIYGGGNLWVYSWALESKYTNESVFFKPNPLFAMEFFAHIFSGACKAVVQSIKSDYGEVDTELRRRNIHKFMTWTKKIQKGVQTLREAQLHCSIKEKCLPTHVLTHFAYMIH